MSNVNFQGVYIKVLCQDASDQLETKHMFHKEIPVDFITFYWKSWVAEYLKICILQGQNRKGNHGLLGSRLARAPLEELHWS